MTVALSYLGDLARVKIEASDIPYPLADVQRSIDGGIRWSIVRGGRSIPTLNAAFSLYDYEFAPGIENQYRVMPSGSATEGLILADEIGWYASTPDTAQLDITGNIDIRADIVKDVWGVPNIEYIVSKYNTVGNQRSYALGVVDRRLQLRWSTDGVGFSNADSNQIPFVIGADNRLAIRASMIVNNGSGSREVRFYWADTMEGPWTQFGDTIVQPATSIFNSTADLVINGNNDGTVNKWDGITYALEIRPGPESEDLRAHATFADATGTPYTDESGLVWDLHSAELTIQYETITPVINDIWIKSVTRPFLNRPIDVRDYSDISRNSRNGVFDIIGRSFPVAVTDVRGSQQFVMDVNTYDKNESDDLELLTMSGDIVYIQTPHPNDYPEPGELFDSLYAVIGNTAKSRLGFDGRRIFSLPLTEIAPPNAVIVGSTVTWQSVVNSFTSWSAVIAAEATWATLNDRIGEPEDVVVP